MRCLYFVLSFLVSFTVIICQSNPYYSNDKIRCVSCASVNASMIIGGAGVDPGVFLSTIKLSSVPVTTRCRDPFDTNDAIKAGASTPICEDGLCVKINYTDKRTASQRCYSCTTLDADELLKEVQDESWKRWLSNVKLVPRTPNCANIFEPEMALRENVDSQLCEQGVCMKMWFKERFGQDHVWRSCIPNAQGSIRPDCTKISSSEGDMEVCTCEGHLCNGSSNLGYNRFLIIPLVLSIFAYVGY